jgi:peptidyl-tRNA hydrolase, PTH1 family
LIEHRLSRKTGTHFFARCSSGRSTFFALLSQAFAMLLFVGLGNPGRDYARNRHNIGFRIVDAIADVRRFAPFRSRFQGLASEGQIGTEKVLLLKPQTYMNESGRAVGEAMHFYKMPLSDVFVIHDELDLAAGRVRIKIGGGNAGHNGLRSISDYVGNDYRRVRIGIGHPGDKERVYGHVLGDFAKAEAPWVEALCEAFAVNAELLVRGEDSGFQNKIHLALAAAGQNGNGSA